MPAHTEGTLWRPWQACVGLCIQDCVPRCASLWDCLSRSGVCVWLSLCLSVPLPKCPLLPLYTHRYVRGAVSVSPSLNVSVCLLCVSFFSQSIFVCISESLCVLFSLSLCVWVSCVSRSFFSAICPSVPVDVCLSPSLCLCSSVRLRCLRLCVRLSLRLCVGLCLFISVSGSLILGTRARGGRASLPELSPVRARGRVLGSGMLGAD